MIDTHPGYLVALIVAVVLMLGIGVWVARWTKSGEDFLLAGRRLGTPLLMGSTLATLVGTGSSLGAVGFGYENGWGGALYGIGGAAGTFLLLILFADVRKHGFMTYAEEMSYYFGANRFIKGLVSLLMVLASVGWLGAHILGGSIYLSFLTGMGDTWAKIVVALSFGLYTIIGGYLAVVITDAIQGLILFLGFTILTVLAVIRVGGMSGIRENAPEEGLSFLGVDAMGPLPALSLAVVVAVGVLATPSFRQRIYSAADVKTVRRSFLLAGVLFAAFSVLPALAGLSAASMAPGLENPDMAFPYLATTLFPLWLGAFLLVAGLSATMSSGDSDAIAGVTILLRDVVQIFTGRVPRRENMVWLSRVALAVVLTGALIGALVATTILDYITTMISTILTGLFAASVLGRFWKRATWVGGVAAMVGGSATALVVNNVESYTAFWGNAVIPSLLAAFLCGIVFSLATRPSRVTPEEALRILAEERAVMDVGTSMRGGEGSTDKQAD